MTQLQSITPSSLDCPFAIHGTFGIKIWDHLLEHFGADLATLERKVPHSVFPLAGVLKMLKEPLPDSLHR